MASIYPQFRSDEVAHDLLSDYSASPGAGLDDFGEDGSLFEDDYQQDKRAAARRDSAQPTENSPAKHDLTLGSRDQTSDSCAPGQTMHPLTSAGITRAEPVTPQSTAEKRAIMGTASPIHLAPAGSTEPEPSHFPLSYTKNPTSLITAPDVAPARLDAQTIVTIGYLKSQVESTLGRLRHLGVYGYVTYVQEPRASVEPATPVESATPYEPASPESPTPAVVSEAASTPTADDEAANRIAAYRAMGYESLNAEMEKVRALLMEEGVEVPDWEPPTNSKKRKRAPGQKSGDGRQSKGGGAGAKKAQARGRKVVEDDPDGDY